MAVDYIGTNNTTSGSSLGNSTSVPLSLYGVTPVTQRTSSTQAAVATTAATSSSPFGFATGAQADAIVTLVNELRAALVALGAIKGS
jgi:hypothetical protein